MHESLRRDMLPLWDYIIRIQYRLAVLQGPGHRPEAFMYIPWDLRLIQFDAGGTGAGGALVLLASIA